MVQLSSSFVFLELFFCRFGSSKQAKTVDRGPVKEEHADMMLSAIVSPSLKRCYTTLFRTTSFSAKLNPKVSSNKLAYRSL